MSQFDTVAATWDDNPIHWNRSEAIANEMLKTLSLKPGMKALEYGAGTAILSFMLNDRFSEITLMDNSQEMVKVMEQKTEASGLKHLKPLFFDLEHHDYTGSSFDIIYSQMVFHHVGNIEALLEKFYKLLNKNGYLVIADLYKEDGSFHDSSFNGHKGFDPEKLGRIIEKAGFSNIKYQPCYVIKKESAEGNPREYPIFLLTAVK